MRYITLGTTDIRVSVLALGCWPFAGDATWGPQDDRQSIETVHAALDMGVNLFDTAEGYGRGKSEQVLGKALQGLRSRAVIATKVSREHLAPDDLYAACERSLRNLQTDYIDLYQIHWPSRKVPLADTLGALERLKEQGKIRAIGVCNFGAGDLSDLFALGRAETNQLPYGLLCRSIEYEILPACRKHGIGILAYMPLMQGLLTGKYRSPNEVPEGRARTRHFSKERPLSRHDEPGCEQETFAAIERIRQICQEAGLSMTLASLAWVLHQPGITSVLVGSRRAEQLAENVQAVDLSLPDDVLLALTEATEEVKRLLGRNPDLYQSGAKSRFR